MIDGGERTTSVLSEWKHVDVADDGTPPTLTYLQFRNKEGYITDQYGKADEGMIYFTAGDFEPEVILNAFGESGFNYNYFEYKPANAKLEY